MTFSLITSIFQEKRSTFQKIFMIKSMKNLILFKKKLFHLPNIPLPYNKPFKLHVGGKHDISNFYDINNLNKI